MLQDADHSHSFSRSPKYIHIVAVCSYSKCRDSISWYIPHICIGKGKSRIPTLQGVLYLCIPHAFPIHRQAGRRHASRVGSK